MFKINLVSLRFSKSGDLSSVLSLLKEESTLPSVAHWNEMCKALKISIYIKSKIVT